MPARSTCTHSFTNPDSPTGGSSYASPSPGATVSDPNGQPTSICGAIQCLVQNVSYEALIGGVEDGQLYFTANDWECQDNSDRFDLVITAY